MSPRERSHRLERTRYIGTVTVAFTACVRNHPTLFTDTALTNRCAELLLDSATQSQSELLIACFMPDHLHAMIRGTNEQSDVLEVFYRFKLRSGIVLRTKGEGARWQKDFYDHIIRSGRDWRSQACYIALNPVRAGLVEDPFDYRTTYSSLGPTNEVLSELFWENS